jgi:hypothetical protein
VTSLVQLLALVFQNVTIFWKSSTNNETKEDWRPLWAANRTGSEGCPTHDFYPLYLEYMPHFDSSVRGYSQKNKNKNNLKYIGEM